MKLHFLYGTETGSAEFLCEDIIEALDDDSLETEISVLADVDPSALEAGTFYMVVTSTFGNGDLPSNAQPFADALDANQPDLDHVRFAIFGLGDMVFSATFNQGSEQLMDKMRACGATMVGERGIHDASTGDMPEDIAGPWAQGILASLRADVS